MASEFTCSISTVSAGSDGHVPPKARMTITLSDVGGTFTNTEFIAVEEAKHEIFGLALAALSANNKVRAMVDPPSKGGSQPTCHSLGIVANP